MNGTYFPNRHQPVSERDLCMKVNTLLMDEFPDFNQQGFDMDRYNQRFHNSNVIINAKSRDVSYPMHWGPLTIKTTLTGEEHYETHHSHYTVDHDHFLVFNNGRMYSSWISSPVDVESFTLNINPDFEQHAIQSICGTATSQLDEPFHHKHYDLRFTERLYTCDHRVSHLIKSIRELSKDFRTNKDRLDLMFYSIMESLLLLQSNTNAEIERVDKVKRSTRNEIFERLVRTKDLIYSCYGNNISVEEMAKVACMNSFYFLRQFRKTFGMTPHQLLTKRRLEVAARLLCTTSIPVTDICTEIGFSDLSSFGKLFRHRYGVSPSGFRTYVKS
jgi:AraC family transcriptional regulator